MASKIVSELATLFGAAQGASANAQQDINDAKTGVVVYGSTTLLLQLISTAAAVTLAYVAVQNMKHHKRTLFANNPKRKRRKS